MPTILSSSTVVDYASLTQALQDWPGRSTEAAYADYFIQFAENRIYRDILAMNEGRGVVQMEAALSGTIANNAIAVPADFLALKYAYVITNSKNLPLTRKNIEFLYGQYSTQTATGTPAFIARDGANFVFGPYADSSYTINGRYWQKAAALSGTNTVTWMVTAIPDVLMAACLVAAAQFVKNEDDVNIWNGYYQQGLNAFIQADKAGAWSGSSLQITAG